MIIINSETPQNKHLQLILMDFVPSSSHYTILCQQLKVQVPPQAPLKAYVHAKRCKESSETKIDIIRLVCMCEFFSYVHTPVRVTTQNQLSIFRLCYANYSKK